MSEKKFLKASAFLLFLLPALPASADDCVLKVDFNEVRGRIKPMHGVNNSPVRLSEGATHHEFTAAGIPFMRTHDVVGRYGGSHFVDIPNVFPDFDADETDPASYDFAFTDAYLKPIVDSGTEIFYRLGVTIENNWRIKAYNIHPPKDFAKWARICEHIVRHYNEGWADGYRWNIKYWEIWGEPENPPLWSGTHEQYLELYRISANHLKKCFPSIKVGGYGGCGFYAIDDKSYRMRHNKFYQGFVTFFDEFCRYVTDEKTKAPLDFFSWHLYLYSGTTPERIARHAAYVRKVLDAHGLKETESSLNEWNWNPSRNWDRVRSHEGAAVMAASLSVMQNSPIDTGMYYDALPTRGHGCLYYFPSGAVTPTYYSFMAFNELYKLGDAVKCEIGGKDTSGLYALAAKGGGEAAVLLANTASRERVLETGFDGGSRAFMVYRVAKGDKELEKTGYLKAGAKLSLPPNSVILLTTRDVDVAAARYKTLPPASSVTGLDDGAQKPKKSVYKRLEVRDVKSVASVVNPAGNTVVDFGAASFGWLEIKGEGEYSIVIGEVTNAAGRVVNPYPAPSCVRAQKLTGEAPGCRYRVPMPPDPLNLKGYTASAPAIRLPKEIGIVYPFRFVEIVKLPCAHTDIVQKAVNYPIDMTKSSFESENADLGRIYEFCKHTIRATSFCGIYVDGDRERTPYEADAYINQLCHYAIDDDCSLARKTHEWLMTHPTWPTEWKQHSVMMAWADWMWSGDTSSLERHYDALATNKLYAGCSVRKDGLLVSPGWKSGRIERDIVDWPVCERDGFVFTKLNAVVNAFHYRNLLEMADIAAKLDEPLDAKRFRESAKRLKAAYDKAFYDARTGLYTDGEGVAHSSLHANAAALAFGLVPDGRKAKIAAFLEAKGMACSVYFAQYFLEALYAAGRDDAAMRFMLARGDRSWLGMLDAGATMTLEAWNVKVKPNLDFNHAWGAVPLNIISRYVLGVTPLEPGFAKVKIAPRPGFIRRLKGVVPTVRGPVKVEIDGDTLRYSSRVPAEVVWKGRVEKL